MGEEKVDEIEQVQKKWNCNDCKEKKVIKGENSPKLDEDGKNVERGTRDRH